MLTDGLALRRASIGPFDLAHLNAPDGVAGVRHSPRPDDEAARALAQTDYDWTPAPIAAAHAELAKRFPIEEVAERQAGRDRRILALRKLKLDDADRRA